MKRIIFHVDVNSAFLSWEAARRVADGEKDIRLIPSAIGGDRDKRTGVILAKSIPAKSFNINTGEPVAMAIRKCPGLFLAKPDFLLYERSSKAFMDICRKYSPIVEKYSIDECFIDMSGMERIYHNPVEVAVGIKNEIRDTLGFTVNIGVGPNKLLAKTASDFKKPDRVHTLFYNEIEEKLWRLPVRELFSVGKATAGRLEKAHILTVGELARSDLQSIKSLIGVKLGVQIHSFANGIDDSPVLAEAGDAKGYSGSTTVEEDIISFDAAYRVILALVDSVTTRMRADGAKARCVSVTIRSYDFKNKSHQRKLSRPTAITVEIFDIAKKLFSELWDKKTPLRLIGVSLTDITRDEFEQLSIFCDEGKERAEKLDNAIDGIRKKYGIDKIARGSILKSQVAKKYKAELKQRGEKSKGEGLNKPKANK